MFRSVTWGVHHLETDQAKLNNLLVIKIGDLEFSLNTRTHHDLSTSLSRQIKMSTDVVRGDVGENDVFDFRTSLSLEIKVLVNVSERINNQSFTL